MDKFSLITPQQVLKHPVNLSVSKATHAFTKSKRFKTHNPECKEAFYNTFTSLSKRKASIGNSKRSDFTLKTEPTPGIQYNTKSEFQKQKNTYTFSISREDEPQRSYLYRFQKTNVPGPGTYENTYQQKKPIMYTQRAKTVDVIKKNYSYWQNPGPGNYQQMQLTNKSGKFRISRFSDVKYSIINKAKRFNEVTPNVPAPNAYKHPDNLNATGKFILSNRRGKGTRPFDKEQKFTISYWKANQNPGPGHYQKPSQFGIYGDANYYKTLGITH